MNLAIHFFLTDIGWGSDAVFIATSAGMAGLRVVRLGECMDEDPSLTSDVSLLGDGWLFLVGLAGYLSRTG